MLDIYNLVEEEYQKEYADCIFKEEKVVWVEANSHPLHHFPKEKVVPIGNQLFLQVVSDIDSHLPCLRIFHSPSGKVIYLQGYLSNISTPNPLNTATKNSAQISQVSKEGPPATQVRREVSPLPSPTVAEKVAPAPQLVPPRARLGASLARNPGSKPPVAITTKEVIQVPEIKVSKPPIFKIPKK